MPSLSLSNSCGSPGNASSTAFASAHVAKSPQLQSVFTHSGKPEEAGGSVGSGAGGGSVGSAGGGGGVVGSGSTGVGVGAGSSIGVVRGASVAVGSDSASVGVASGASAGVGVASAGTALAVGVCSSSPPHATPATSRPKIAMARTGMNLTAIPFARLPTRRDCAPRRGACQRGWGDGPRASG